MRFNRRLSALALLFICVGPTHGQRLSPEQEFFYEMNTKHMQRQATLNDAQQLLEKAFDLYRAGDFELAHSMATLGNRVHVRIRGSAQDDGAALEELAQQQRELSDPTQQKEGIAFAGRPERDPRVEDATRIYLQLQVNPKSAAEKYWLQSVTRLVLMQKERRLSEVLKKEVRTTCGMLVDRYAALPQSERTISLSPSLKARWCS